jgi:hypothetical protein
VYNEQRFLFSSLLNDLFDTLDLFLYFRLVLVGTLELTRTAKETLASNVPVSVGCVSTKIYAVTSRLPTQFYIRCAGNAALEISFTKYTTMR